MGQATRTTKLLLDLGKRSAGGANREKRAALDATTLILTQARAFYIDFFLAHAHKLAERVSYYSETHLEQRERLISTNELLTWAEACTVELQRKLSHAAFPVPEKRDQGFHRQGEVVSLQSAALGKERQ